MIAYKFNTLDRDEVTQMLGIELNEVRAFQDAKTEGEQTILLRVLRSKFDSLSPQDQERIESLNTDQLQELADTLVSLVTLRDLTNWLDTKC